MDDRWFRLGDHGRYPARPMPKMPQYKLKWLFVAVAAVSILLGVVSWIANYDSPRRYFRRVTGLSLPNSARLVREWSTESGPLSSDGDRILEFEMQANDLQSFLANKPPWGNRWKNGLIPDAYAITGLANRTPQTYSTFNFAPENGEQNIHDGAVLAIDTNRGRITLAAWWY